MADEGAPPRSLGRDCRRGGREGGFIRHAVAQIDWVDHDDVALAAHDLDLSHVVQLRTYVVNHDLDTLGEIAKCLGQPPPTHTVRCVSCLATPEMMFEGEAVAVRS